MLFASLTKAIFGDGTLPMDKIWLGVAMGVVIVFVDEVFLKTKKFRLHLMPIAVGIYLPVTLATPMVLGGLVEWLVKRKNPHKEEGNDEGILLSSGLVAGESVMGVIVALLITFKIDLSIKGVPSELQEALSVIAILALALFLKKKAQK